MSNPSDQKPSPVMIVDDDLLVRRALSDYLSLTPDLELGAALASGEEAVEYAKTHPVGLVLLDVRMGGIDGLETARRLLSLRPEAKIVMLTSFDDDQLVHASFKAGALGYVLKSARASQIIAALRAARQGLPVMSPSVLAELSEPHSRQPLSNVPHLTSRESEILRELCQGKSNAEIARALVLSQSAVKMHLRSLMNKLGTRSRLETVVYAHERGLNGTGVNN